METDREQDFETDVNKAMSGGCMCRMLRRRPEMLMLFSQIQQRAPSNDLIGAAAALQKNTRWIRGSEITTYKGHWPFLLVSVFVCLSVSVWMPLSISLHPSIRPFINPSSVHFSVIQYIHASIQSSVRQDKSIYHIHL